MKNITRTLLGVFSSLVLVAGIASGANAAQPALATSDSGMTPRSEIAQLADAEARLVELSQTQTEAQINAIMGGEAPTTALVDDAGNILAALPTAQLRATGSLSPVFGVLL